ncbi:hypothetical protein VPH35_013991 [Triticum aestivum]
MTGTAALTGSENRHGNAVVSPSVKTCAESRNACGAMAAIPVVSPDRRPSRMYSAGSTGPTRNPPTVCEGSLPVRQGIPPHVSSFGITGRRRTPSPGRPAGFYLSQLRCRAPSSIST